MRSSKRNITLGIFLVIFSSCKEPISNSSSSTSSIIDTVLICQLSENKEFISQIDDAAFINDSTFVLITNKQIHFYNTNGIQLNTLEKKGTGPHEYITPSLINVNDTSIYIWCSSTLELLQYNIEGNFINAIENYGKAIKSFKVYDDKYIFFYKNDGTKDGIIDIYDIKEEQIIKTIGTYSDEDLLLLMMNFKPEIILFEEYLYFIRPSSLNIYRFSINNFELETFAYIEDEEYSIQKIDDALFIINKQREYAFKYLYDNCLTDNIFLTKNGIIIKSEVGKYKLNHREKSIDREARFNKFYQLKNHQKDNTWRTNMLPNHYNYINYNQCIYIIQSPLDDSMEKTTLFKLFFNE